MNDIIEQTIRKELERLEGDPLTDTTKSIKDQIKKLQRRLKVHQTETENRLEKIKQLNEFLDGSDNNTTGGN